MPLCFNHFFVSVPQGWTSVSDRSGSGRWSLLSGSGGGHHRAHSPLHPGGGSQHLQCHADEPQLCTANTGAVNLASSPHQVKPTPEIHADSKFTGNSKHTVVICPFNVSNCCRRFRTHTVLALQSSSKLQPFIHADVAQPTTLHRNMTPLCVSECFLCL